MISSCDHILFVHVGNRKNVKQTEPRSGAPEKALKFSPVGTFGMVYEFTPAIAIACQDTRWPQIYRRIAGIQPLDNADPARVKPEILWLIEDLASVSEADQLDGAAEIVQIRKATFDVRHKTFFRPAKESRADAG
jgi:hypothetical protein